jgi:hypothetical protein
MTPGDLVELNSGSCALTVCSSVRTDASGSKLPPMFGPGVAWVHCEWFVGGIRQKGSFPVAALKPYVPKPEDKEDKETEKPRRTEMTLRFGTVEHAVMAKADGTLFVGDPVDVPPKDAHGVSLNQDTA